MTETVDCVVIGAGVIGLAVARAFTQAGHEVIVLEGAEAIGTETSSRNSEVIHAGIYYPKDSLKARFCVAGKKALYAYCEERGVPHRRCTKMIVAAEDAQTKALHGIRTRAEANGVDDLVWLEGTEARKLEPELRCAAALLSPSTGIIDSHGLMLAYQGDAEDRGAMIAFHSPVEGGWIENDGIVIDVGGAEPMQLKARILVNSGGLHAPRIAASLEGFPTAHLPKAFYAKGNYYSLTGRAPFTRLIYPVPEPGGLGVHITLDLAGQARFGPDVEWLDSIDYTVKLSRADGFYEAVRSYWPSLGDGMLTPGYAGIRPKVVGPGEPDGDFIVQGPAEHGVAGLVNLFGIESPGLTASMPLAEAALRAAKA